jgi:arylsulfate sulfotransferase
MLVLAFRGKFFWKSMVLSAVCLLSACGAPEASISDIRFSASHAGVTPFIAFVELAGRSLASVQSISYVIEPKVGSASRPVNVTYTVEALKRRAYIGPDTATLPVFGLYAGYANAVSISLHFNDGSSQAIKCQLIAGDYSDPHGIYDKPVFVRRRSQGSKLGFDYFAMKSIYGTPVVVDTDGEVRWVGVNIVNGFSAVVSDNGFVIGDQFSPTAYRVELDGSIVTITLAPSDYTRFHHNIDPGRSGLIGEFNTPANIQSTLGEFTAAGQIAKEWDLAALLSAYMLSQGDDPSSFVRPGTDWFHSNAAVYDPRDNSLIVSSRENFLIKVDYDSGNILWILGDPTKYWYTFPSLRARALALRGSGLYPIGQHAVSITSDGLVMIFNDGNGSVQQPSGAPAGESRTYSAVSAYSIDEASQSATEQWRFDYGQSIYSSFCGSAYEAPEKSLLIDYALADNGTQARMVGLDDEHQIVFDIQYSNDRQGCDTSWNAEPIHLENMRYQ